MLCIRIADRFDVVDHAAATFAPYAKSLPCLIVAGSVALFLCIPFVTEKLMNLLAAIREINVGSVRVTLEPSWFFDGKNQERMLQLVRVIERGNGVQNDGRSVGDSGEENKSVEMLMDDWKKADERERNILLRHANRIGARLLGQNVRINGGEAVFDGCFQKGGNWIVAEVKTLKSVKSVLDSVSRQLDSFCETLDAMSDSEASRWSFHLLLDVADGCKPSRDQLAPLQALLDRHPRSKLLIYS